MNFSTLPPHLRQQYQNDRRVTASNQALARLLNPNIQRTPLSVALELGGAWLHGRNRDRAQKEYSEKGNAWRNQLSNALINYGKDPQAGAQSLLAVPGAEQHVMAAILQGQKPETFGQPYSAAGEDGTQQLIQAGNRGTILPVEGYTPATKDEPLVAIYDPESPTGTRMVPQSEAAGQPAAKKDPLVHVGNQKPTMPELLAEGDVEAYRERATKAREMVGTLGQYDRLLSLLDAGVQTGYGQETLGRLKSFASGVLGVDVDTTGLAGQEAFNAIANAMVAPLVKQLGQNPTDRDLQFIVAAAPSLDKSPEGNRLIIEAAKRNAVREQQLVQMQRAHLEQNGSLNGWATVEASFYSENPLFNDQERETLRTLVNAAGGQQSGELPRYQPGGQQRFRWNPETGGIDPVGPGPGTGWDF